MNQEKLTKIIEAMSEISYHDWVKLKMVVDQKFDIQRRELEKTLQLSTNSPTIEELIHSQFGTLAISCDHLQSPTLAYRAIRGTSLDNK